VIVLEDLMKKELSYHGLDHKDQPTSFAEQLNVMNDDDFEGILN